MQKPEVQYPNINWNDHHPDTNAWANDHTVSGTFMYGLTREAIGINIDNHHFPIPASLVLGILICALWKWTK